MRRGRILIFVILIILVGLVVGFFLLQQVLRLGFTQNQAPANVEIYVAAQNIPQGGAITEAVLTTITVPADKVISVEFTRDELAQLTTNKIARLPLDQGTVITEAMVADKSLAVAVEGPQWANLIPVGKVAVGVPISRLGLSGYAVADGAHVNVTVCLNFVDLDPDFQSPLPNHVAVVSGTGILPDQLPVLSLGATSSSGEGAAIAGRLELDPSLQQPFYVTPSDAPRPRTVCQLLLQDVPVLRAGNFPVEGETAADNQQTNQQQQQGETTTTPVTPDIVTLIVSPQDANTLTHLAFSDANIQLSLRNPTDQSRQATEAATLQFLLSQYNIPVPAKLPYGLDPLAAPVLLNDAPPAQQ